MKEKKMGQWTNRSKIATRIILTDILSLPGAKAAEIISKADSKPGRWRKVNGVQIRRDGDLYSLKS